MTEMEENLKTKIIETFWYKNEALKKKNDNSCLMQYNKTLNIDDIRKNGSFQIYLKSIYIEYEKILNILNIISEKKEQTLYESAQGIIILKNGIEYVIFENTNSENKHKVVISIDLNTTNKIIADYNYSYSKYYVADLCIVVIAVALYVGWYM